MLILDTDHLSEFDRASTVGQTLMARLSASGDRVAVTIVSFDEQLRGRLSQLARAKDREKLIDFYRKLQDTLEGLSRGTILPWTLDATSTFERLKRQRHGIGTMDLRIASIAIATGATLLSRNLRDFQLVPDLKVEDWLS